MAWLAFSGLANNLLGEGFHSLVLTSGLLLTALSFAALGRVPFGRLMAPDGDRGLIRMGQGMTSAAVLAALLALLPWNACRLASAALLGALLPLLSVLSLIRATRQSDLLRSHVEAQNEELALRMKELEAARHSAESANHEIQLAMEQLEQAASTDRLTGAWNRRHFEEVAQSEMALANRRSDPLALIMFDLDHFKRVNDTYGHGTGDMVLVSTAQTVRAQLRASDALIRWGGEEFLVMLPATGQEGTLALAEKLRSAVEAVSYPEVGQVTVSLGAAVYVPGESITTWVERVDAALYQAKNQGRNRVVAATAPASPPMLPPNAILQVVWEDAYGSGHPLIDTQHQGLFRMASLLMAGLTEGQPQEEIALRLQKLIAHSAQHFMDEESLLRAARYTDLPQHMVIHADLLNRARELHQQVISGHLDFGVLVSFLAKDLVMGHLLTEDRNYFSTLVETK
jgi:diguanylate cyclase (GGDEF)-like protein/hemerythrin-like metal-binding protein